MELGIEKLFDEAGNYFAFYEDIKLSNGKIIKGHKSLDVYQCKEIPGIKPKI